MPALQDISMTVGAGRFVVLVGPSGCGKTSLLMMMAGLRHQTSGTIHVQGAPIDAPDPDRVGVVFQEASLFPWLTALDNIEFPLALRRAPKAERGARANDMLNLVGLQGFGSRYPHELSGGMKQRVSIARGLVQDPPVLLMDEPFAALDEQTRMTMGHELLRIWSQTAKTVMFVTHSLTEAVYLADEVLVMSARPGRIIDRIPGAARAPAQLRDDGHRSVRQTARPHLAADPEGGVMTRPSPATVRWLILAALLVFWELFPRTGMIPELFLPALSKVLAVLAEDWRMYLAQLGVTLYEVAFAMLIACGFGILAGALVGGIALLRNLLLPVFSSLYAVPIVILYPIFTAWFGIGSELKIIFAGVYGFFPVMLSTAAGIRTIDEQLLLAARSMGATLPQQITRVIIPASIPTVLTGLRLGGALTIIGVVVSEMLTSAAGIGYVVTYYRTILDSSRVFGAIVMILLLSILFDMFARAIERRTMVWQTAGRRQKEGEEPQVVGAPVPAPVWLSSPLPRAGEGTRAK